MPRHSALESLLCFIVMFQSFSDILRVTTTLRAANASTRDRVLAEWDTRTKPPGSLGRLEELAAWVASVQDTPDAPKASRMSLRLFGGAHGITAEGVSAVPDSVNQQMMQNFHHGGAAINALCRSNGIDFRFYDAGINHPTRNFLYEAAMSESETVEAFALGWQSVPRFTDVFAVGEMGIGNTTPSVAILSAITGVPAETIIGRGTGLSDPALAHKTAVIQKALENRSPEFGSPLSILASVGGREIAAMTGAILSAASMRIPVVLDGVIAGAAAAIAFELNPACISCCLAGHRSAEPAHDCFLRHYELRPLLDFGMRLGEGTGAAVAMGIVRNAVDAFNQMATFAQAGVVI